MTTLTERPTASEPEGRRALPNSWRATRLRAPRNRSSWTLDLTLVALLTAVVVATHLHALGGGPSPGDDEGTYVAQAYAINHFGSLAPYTYWYDHPPLGWILLALWNATFGHLTSAGDAVAAGRQFLVVVAAATGALIYVLGRRLGLRRWAACAAVLLWAFSPLALGYSRMVYLDNIAMPLLLGSLVLALSPRRHLAAFTGAGALLAMAVLTKETLVLSAPAVGYAAWRTSAGRTRSFCVAAFASTALLVGALYPLLAILRGELLPGPNHVSLYDAVTFQLFTRPSSGSPLGAGSQAHGLVATWLHTDPWLLAGGVLLAPLALWIRRLRPAAIAVVVPVVLSLRPGYLPDPFVICLLPFCALLLAAAGDVLVALAADHATAGLRAGWRNVVQRGSALPVAGAALRREDGHWVTASPLRRLRPAAVAGVLAAVLIGLVSATVGPAWSAGDRSLYGDTQQQTIVAAEDWMALHVPHTSRIVVDDTLWVDLVSRGFDPHLGVIWFYKTDFTNNLDPSVARQLPAGYRDVNYVVSTPVIRSALEELPHGLTELRAALTYSVPIAAFGTDSQQIVVRKVVVPASAPQLPSPVKP